MVRFGINLEAGLADGLDVEGERKDKLRPTPMFLTCTDEWTVPFSEIKEDEKNRLIGKNIK